MSEESQSVRPQKPREVEPSWSEDEVQPLIEEAPRVEAVAPQDRDLARRDPASAEAMRDLAIAFRTSAEAIDGVRTLQGELVQALKRQDRSELVLRSTESLNESFRNLGAVQRELLDRLEKDRRSGPGRLVPMMMIGLLIVFLGGTYAVVVMIDQVRAERQDGAALVERATTKALEAYRGGLEERDATYVAEMERLRSENEQVRQRAEALLTRADREGMAKSDLLKEKRQLEGELDHLAQRMLSAQNQVLAKRALEEEIQENESRLAVVEPRLRELQEQLDGERELTVRLKKRLAALGYGLPDPEPKEPTPEGEGEEATEKPPTDPSKRVDRHPGLLDKIQGRLNEIFRQSASPQESYWQIRKIEGVTPDGLVDVVVSVYQRGTAKLLQEINAKDVRFYIDRTQRSAHMEIRGGMVRDAKGVRPVPAEGMSYRVAAGEMYRLWSQSGLLFVRTR